MIAISATRATGLAAYAFAALCAGFAWAKDKRGSRERRLAAIITAIEAALSLDIAFNWRWMLHQLFDDVAMRRGVYELRRGPQAAMIAAIVGLLSVASLLAFRRLRSRPGALLAVLGVCLSLALWCAEVVSLHALDAALYHPVGPWMRVAFLWVLSSAMTSAGILIESRAAGSAAGRQRKFTGPLSKARR